MFFGLYTMKIQLLIPCLFLVLPSCTILPTLFGSCRQDYTVLADDSRAEIYFDGKMVGTGRATVNLYAPNSDGFLSTVKLGNRAEYHKSVCGLSSWGIADVAAGSILVVPLLGLMFPGAYEQHPNNAIVRIAPATHVVEESRRP